MYFKLGVLYHTGAYCGIHWPIDVRVMWMCTPVCRGPPTPEVGTDARAREDVTITR